ncbi:MAG TPA: hypothetical protein VFG87_25165 [Amycolatopsis sp.]|jgi:hypothetical protein|nr:hypothetical protein [Amycolatopsis sp.]
MVIPRAGAILTVNNGLPSRMRASPLTTSVAELTRTARPILLDLADRPDVRETARHWQHRVDIHTVETDDRPADALLIRPDAHIAWAATTNEPADTAVPALREALCCWFGTPRTTAAPRIDRPS